MKKLMRRCAPRSVASPHQTKEGSGGKKSVMLGRPGSSSHTLAGVEAANLGRIRQNQQGFLKDGIQEVQVGAQDGQPATDKAALGDQARSSGMPVRI